MSNNGMEPKSIVHQMIHLERKGSKIVTKLWQKCKKAGAKRVKSKSLNAAEEDETCACETIVTTWPKSNAVGVDEEDLTMDDSMHISSCILQPLDQDSDQIKTAPPCRMSYDDVTQEEFLHECLVAPEPGQTTIVHIHHKDFAGCSIIDDQLQALVSSASLPESCRALRLSAIDAPFVTIRLKVFQFPTVIAIRDRQVVAQCTGGSVRMEKWLKEQL